MKPLKAGIALKIRTRNGFTIVDIKSRRKIKKKHRVKFYYIIDRYGFNDKTRMLKTEKDVETTLNYFRSLYQDGKVEHKIQDVNTFLAKAMLDNYTQLDSSNLWTVTYR